jgi:hypothetical protein
VAAQTARSGVSWKLDSLSSPRMRELPLESVAHEFTSCTQWARREPVREEEQEEFHMQKEFNHPRLSPGVSLISLCLPVPIESPWCQNGMGKWGEGRGRTRDQAEEKGSRTAPSLLSSLTASFIHYIIRSHMHHRSEWLMQKQRLPFPQRSAGRV